MSSSSTLLRKTVDASLSDITWMKVAKWLKPSTLKCFPATMLYGQTNCASRALSVFIGKNIPVMPGGGRSLSIDTVIETASKYGKTIKLLYDIGVGGSVADKCFLFGTVPESEGGRSGHRGCLIPVRCLGTEKLANVKPKMQAILNTGIERMILIVFNSALYEFGHCLVIRKLRDKYYLSDPLLPAGTCLELPSGEAMLLLMCSANTILGS